MDYARPQTRAELPLILERSDRLYSDPTMSMKGSQRVYGPELDKGDRESHKGSTDVTDPPARETNWSQANYRSGPEPADSI